MRHGSEVEAGQIPALRLLRRGLAASPELRKGAVLTLALALVAGGGRVVTPVLVQQTIDRLPGGYSAPLAETPMSGGELQRLGLARALAQEARLLVLDDATSSLDTATEAEIASVLTAHAGDRTRLIVTHRTTTAARADLVAWLDAGRIRALGPHHTLWSDPAYRAIFRPEPSPSLPPNPGPPRAATGADDHRARTRAAITAPGDPAAETEARYAEDART